MCVKICFGYPAVMVAFFVLNLFLFGMAILLCWLSCSYGSLYILILAICSYLLIECLFSMSTAIMSSSYPRNNFMETDAKFLEFENDLDNIVGGSLSMGDNTGSSSQ
uniref:Uncharacterized protein n=1 Tax=Cucumis melo TaxID=3656 RepID=A0A9I9EIB8_CUCME